MRRLRDARPYLQDMLDSIERIRRYTAGMDSAAFHEDEVVQDAVIRRIEVMGEAVSYLPDDLKARFPQVPWQDVKDMRNKLIHDYGHVDLELVWAVVRKDIPALEPALRQILSGM
jgi:uncharacterized protein with HEPN domain